MSNFRLWVVESRQTSPNDFYVKVDGSEFYTAYWVVRSSSKQRAEELVLEASEELVLGDTEIIETQPYEQDALIKDETLMERIRLMSTKLSEQEDAQLGAWVSSDGGLW